MYIYIYIYISLIDAFLLFRSTRNAIVLIFLTEIRDFLIFSQKRRVHFFLRNLRLKKATIDILRPFHQNIHYIELNESSLVPHVEVNGHAKSALAPSFSKFQYKLISPNNLINQSAAHYFVSFMYYVLDWIPVSDTDDADSIFHFTQMNPTTGKLMIP